MIHTAEISLQTKGHMDLCDITEKVADEVKRSGLSDGIVTVFCPSSTSALTTMEFEDGTVADLRRAFDEIAPSNREYHHNRRWRNGNGHSHLRAALLGPSLTVPFTKGQLRLGRWQQVTFVDFDVRPRRRTLVVQMMGE